MNKHKCDCGKEAVFLYMPGFSNGGNPFQCDTCVNRGCTCNYRYTNQTPPTDEDKPWKWVIDDEIKEGEVWVRLDELGREYTCAEYDYSSDGYELEEFNEDEFER